MKKSNALIGAAIAGLIGAATASTAMADDKGMTKNVGVEKCYGINACKGHGKCGQAGHACAGENSCKGQGWIEVIKGTCMDIQGGSLTAPKN